MEEVIIDPSLNVPIPHFCKYPTNFTISDGNWSDSNVWSNGSIPTDNDIVNILHNIIYDVVSDHVLKGICIEDFGSLIINEGITKLIAQNFMVMHEGMLTIQCVKEESLCEIIIADLPLDLINDPYQYGNGLLVFGSITINGMLRTPYGRVISEPIKGDSALGLEIPEDWKIKDEIFIADTQAVLVSPPLPDRTEFRIINDRLDHLIGIDPLTFDHKGWRNKEGILDQDCLPHVVNITRNVVIKSANPNNRGHVLFMHDAQVDIQGARFKDLGRTTIAPLNNTKVVNNVLVIGTNQIGKYACHFHHVKNVCKFNYNVIERSSKWGLTIHNTHFSHFTYNVIVDASGAGIMLEAGNETDNVIAFNFICKITGTGSRGDNRGTSEFGFEGTGIWARGVNNFINDNIVCSVRTPNLAGFGYKLFQSYLGSPGDSIRIPTAPNQDPSEYIIVNPYQLSIKQFERNECYGCGNALTYWWIGTKNNKPEIDVPLSIIEGLIGWNIRAGITHYPAYNILISSNKLRGSSVTVGGAGIYCGDYLAGEFRIENCDIQGFQLGVQPSTITLGQQIFKDLLLRNVTNYRFDLLWTSSSSGIGLKPRRILIINPINKRWGTGFDYSTYYTPNQVCNLVEKNEIFVEGNENFEILFLQQKPDFIMPSTTYNPNGSPRIIGCPESGLTNQQAFDKYGIALNGKIAENYVMRPDVLGLVRMIV